MIRKGNAVEWPSTPHRAKLLTQWIEYSLPSTTSYYHDSLSLSPWSQCNIIPHIIFPSFSLSSTSLFLTAFLFFLVYTLHTLGIFLWALHIPLLFLGCSKGQFVLMWLTEESVIISLLMSRNFLWPQLTLTNKYAIFQE